MITIDRTGATIGCEFFVDKRTRRNAKSNELCGNAAMYWKISEDFKTPTFSCKRHHEERGKMSSKEKRILQNSAFRFKEHDLTTVPLRYFDDVWYWKSKLHYGDDGWHELEEMNSAELEEMEKKFGDEVAIAIQPSES